MNDSIFRYTIAMSVARNMLEKGLISENDIVSIEDKLAQKYMLKFGSIYREIDLINIQNRANICHEKEAILCQNQSENCNYNHSCLG